MILNAHPILGYPGYLPPRTGLVSQGYPQDPTCRFLFIATLDLPDLSRIMNDPIYYYPY